jgi:hypothetical protein
VAAAAWVTLLAILARIPLAGRLTLLALALVTPAYIVLYSQGYVRPSHHPESAGVYESLRVALQAQAMAFGPSGGGMWPSIGVVILFVGLSVLAHLIRPTFRAGLDLRAAGLLLFVLAGGALAFGIGWGRSGFHNDMGLAWRYGWITFPSVAAAYFTWLSYRSKVSTYGPWVLLIAAAIMTPANEVSGFWQGERGVRANEQAWEADVRAGLTADEVAERHIPPGQAGWRPHVARMMRIMRDHDYAYYGSLGREAP